MVEVNERSGVVPVNVIIMGSMWYFVVLISTTDRCSEI
jgi:hypothetical protein